MNPPYPAELYALLHTGNPGDLAFYRERCRDGDRILELGCGYGRVLDALGDREQPLIGIDLHPGLLALAARRLAGRPANLIRSDMRSFCIAQTFDRILIPYSGIFCMLSSEDVVRCLTTAAQHLAKDGGRLIFDAYSADAFHRESAGDLDRLEERDEFEDVVSIDHDGQTYDVLESSSWVPNDQRLDVIYLYEPRGGGPAIRATLAHRYILSDQIEPLLKDAGLRLESLSGDFDGSPVCEDSDSIVVEAALA